LLTFVFF